MSGERKCSDSELKKLVRIKLTEALKHYDKIMKYLNTSLRIMYKNQYTTINLKQSKNINNVKSPVIFINPGLKSHKSLKQKLLRKCRMILVKGKTKNDAREILKDILTWDVMRCTIIYDYDKDDFSKNVNDFINQIVSNKKYVLEWVDNHMCVPNNFFGLNINFVKHGNHKPFQFEVQFHTKITYIQKDNIHKYYKEFRKHLKGEQDMNTSFNNLPNNHPLKQSYCKLITENNKIKNNIPTYTYNGSYDKFKNIKCTKASISNNTCLNLLNNKRK